MPKQKIRIILKAFDHRILDMSAVQIVEAAERTGAAVAGPIPMPTSIKRFCVIRSPHIDKNSREHFELRAHTRALEPVIGARQVEATQLVDERLLGVAVVEYCAVGAAADQKGPWGVATLGRLRHPHLGCDGSKRGRGRGGELEVGR